jgi:hypothetical protein
MIPMSLYCYEHEDKDEDESRLTKMGWLGMFCMCILHWHCGGILEVYVRVLCSDTSTEC